MGSDTTKTPSTLQACSFVFESFLGILPLDPRFFFSVVPAASDVGGGRNGNPGAAGGGKRARRRRLRWRYRVGRGGRLGACRCRPDTRQLVPTAMDDRSRHDGDTDGGSRLEGSSDDEDAGPDIWTKRPRPTPAKSTASPAGPPAVDSPSGGRC